jgi:hypothetical protein
VPGAEVRVRRLGRGALLEPMEPNLEDIKAIFAEIDRLGGNEFLSGSRQCRLSTMYRSINDLP